MRLTCARRVSGGMTMVRYTDLVRRGAPDALYNSEWSFQLAFVVYYLARKHTHHLTQAQPMFK